MGFWDVVGRMAQGKPAFEDPNASSAAQSVPPTPVAPSSAPAPAYPLNKTPVDASGRKIIPEISIHNCRSYLNGNRIEVRAWVKNHSEYEIEIDKVSLLGSTTQLDRRLRPGESHEMKFYQGAVPTTDRNDNASVDYILVRSNDYFRAEFMIEFEYIANQKIYLVEEFHPEDHVRDI